MMPQVERHEDLRESLEQAYLRLLAIMKQYSYVHGVRNLLGPQIRQARIVWRHFPASHPLRLSLRSALKDATTLKRLMSEFWKGKKYWLCSYDLCPTRWSHSMTKEHVAWKTCTKCKVALYCTRECQKADWQRSHRERCGNSVPQTPGPDITFEGHRQQHLSQRDVQFLMFLTEEVIRALRDELFEQEQLVQTIEVDYRPSLMLPAYHFVSTEPLPSSISDLDNNKVTGPQNGKVSVRVRIRAPGGVEIPLYICKVTRE
ncbi:hypothetical protein VNI00_016084 [Paramarasmius palmivorus]|uniref:MYND-type domain-containing protein n=1 Tax=Paramarasmius palmivorus TaxID=297713 RepID=A0AAW0BGP5_9AGAR